MADLLRVSIKGDQPTGEVWSVNPVFSIGGDFGAPVSAAQAMTIATAIDAITIASGVLAMFPSSTRIVGCRVEARKLDGTLESLAEHARGAPVGGSASSAGPLQTALVSSLRTTHPGPSGRGRLYWPAMGVPVGLSTYRPTPANMSTYSLGVKTYLSAIQAAVDVTLDGVALAVWSRKDLELYVVNSIQVGDILDTQRRRRDATIENYTVQTYP